MPSGMDKKLMIVPGASHLFEEPGTLEQAAELAKDWFLAHYKSGERPISFQAEGDIGCGFSHSPPAQIVIKWLASLDEKRALFTSKHYINFIK